MRTARTLLLLFLIATPRTARADGTADQPRLVTPLPAAPAPTAEAVAAANALPAAAAPNCPEPCAACAARVGQTVAPSQPMATWQKALMGVGIAVGGALTIFAQGRQAGAW